jgi:glycosyltransferase involved in cell wall biosynthesis
VKIAYLCADPGIALLGHKGASVHLRSLAGALARRGHDVCLLADRVDGENPPPANVTVARLTDESLTRVLEDWACEVVLERYCLASGKALEASRALGIAYVLELNAPLADEAARYRGLRDVETWRSRERAILNAADAVVAVSSGVRAYAIQCGVAPTQVVVVHNGVDVDRFESVSGEPVRRRHRLGLAQVVGFVGSLKPWHGVDLLLRAAAGLDQAVRILIVGDGPQRAEVEALAGSLHIDDRVVLTGALPYHAIPEYLAAMTVGAAPYRGQEDFYFSPLKVAEYLAAGLPIVGTRQGDLPKLVGEAGLLVTPNDVSQLREALHRVLSDHPMRQRMQRAARRRARAMTWNEAAARVETVLASARAGQQPGSGSRRGKEAAA